MRASLVAAATLLAGGCVDRAAPVWDASAEARRGGEAALAVHGPRNLAGIAWLGRCRPGSDDPYAQHLYFDPHVVDPERVLARVMAERLEAVRWSADARLVAAEVRCDDETFTIAVDGLWFSEARAEVWHPAPRRDLVPAALAIGARPIEAEDVEAALRRTPTPWVDRVVVRASLAPVDVGEAAPTGARR